MLSERWALSLTHLLIVCWFGAFFLYYNYLPLYHSDIWGHVAYGHWILDHRTLPQQDPFVSLAQGVHVTDSAWLSQVLFAWADGHGGPAWISHIFALTILATFVIWTRVFYLQTGRAGLAVGGAILAWLIGLSRHAVVRPEIFGSLCLAALLWLIVRTDLPRAAQAEETSPPPANGGRSVNWGLWIGVFLLFAVWANLHGSFVIGLAVLGCWTLGRGIDVVWERKSLKAVFTDPLVRRNLLLTELAVAASLLNPDGIDLLIHTLTFSGNPNLNDVLEWFRLEIVSLVGLEVGISWVLMLILFRHSRRRITATDVLLLAVFIPAVCLRIRMVTWYAPLVTLVLMPHLSDVLESVSARLPAWWSRGDEKTADRQTPPSFRYTLLAGLVIWLTFAFAPISNLILGGKTRNPDHLYSQDTPFELTKYLRHHPPKGPIANPQWWGDWLVWNGPPHLQVFMTTNAVHLAPPRVWKDYLAIARDQPGLTERLDRYAIDTMIVDKTQQTRLARTVRRLNGWNVVYEDELGLIAQRKDD